MDYTIFSDFTTAECYALNEQLAALGVGATVLWKGVQLDPAAASPMRALDRRARDNLDDELQSMRRFAPELAFAVPKGKPKSERAILAVASVMRLNTARAAAFRDAVFRAYWRDGTDISVKAELQRIADSVDVPRFIALDHPDADETIEGWELDWATERLGGVPRVIRGDGKILWGLRPFSELEAFFSVPAGTDES
jgi:predicted DsbA family dithiol-disulfide isomerase